MMDEANNSICRTIDEGFRLIASPKTYQKQEKFLANKNQIGFNCFHFFLMMRGILFHTSYTSDGTSSSFQTKVVITAILIKTIQSFMFCYFISIYNKVFNSVPTVRRIRSLLRILSNFENLIIYEFRNTLFWIFRLKLTQQIRHNLQKQFLRLN